MMRELIEWSRTNGVTEKITLLTREDNEVAIQLYKQLGFETEGILKNDNFINGIYYNTLSMGLLLQKN